MATRILCTILLACALAACGGASEPGSPEPAPVESCWHIEPEGYSTTQWVWTCEGHPPPTPPLCSWVDHDDTRVMSCPDELPSGSVPAGCELTDVNVAHYLYTCGAAK
ncbi:MAG TPA: hypothetical protein VFQ35_00020 [Polyangiaceae bacterium]|nr:hypothetical protein [Polyangiaceae bacterium]